IVAARQMLQPAADQDAAARLQFGGIGEIHRLFRQQRTQMFIDLLEGRVLEGFMVPLCRLPFSTSLRTDRFLTILYLKQYTGREGSNVQPADRKPTPRLILPCEDTRGATRANEIAGFRAAA